MEREMAISSRASGKTQVVTDVISELTNQRAPLAERLEKGLHEGIEFAKFQAMLDTTVVTPKWKHVCSVSPNPCVETTTEARLEHEEPIHWHCYDCGEKGGKLGPNKPTVKNTVEVTPEVFDALREIFPDLHGNVEIPHMNRETRRKQAKIVKKMLKGIKKVA